MRKSLGILAAGALVFGAPAASAAPVNGYATLSISIEGGLAPITLSHSGTWDVSGSTVTLGAGLVNLATPITLPVTGTTSMQSIQAVGIANQTGTFSLGGLTAQLPGEVCASAAPGEACNAGGGIGGAMGISGALNVIVIPMLLHTPVDLDDAGVGRGGSVTAPFLMDNAGWTTGQAFVRTDDATVGSLQATTIGGGHPTTGGGYPMTLVTTTYLNALGNILPITTTLTLAVPEPGSLLLLASGIAGLALAGRSRK